MLMERISTPYVASYWNAMEALEGQKIEAMSLRLMAERMQGFGRDPGNRKLKILTDVLSKLHTGAVNNQPRHFRARPAHVNLDPRQYRQYKEDRIIIVFVFHHINLIHNA